MMPTPSHKRHAVAFVTWGSVDGRSKEIAEALGGEAWPLRSLPGLGPRGTPLRYLISAIKMLALLATRRPEAIITTNPPIVPGLIAWLYASVTGAVVVLDSHPGSFGLQGDTASRRMMGLHRWLVPRVRGVLVTESTLATRVREWGGEPHITHEAPPLWLSPASFPVKPQARPRVLFVGVFGGDEPVDAVIDAARQVPEVDFRITGDTARCPADLLIDRPDNVLFLGYIRSPGYERELRGASVVMTLSTEPSSVMRAAYEAVYAERPLVTSDWNALRENFPQAIHVKNEADAIAVGIRSAIARLGELESLAPGARARQSERWADQLAELSVLVSGDRSPR